MKTKRHASLGHRLLVSILLILLLLAAGVVPSDAREPAPEDAVKAAMLYNFVQFVRWPEAVLPAVKPELVLGILGRDPLQEWLLDLAAEGSSNGLIKTVQLGSLQELAAQKHQLLVLYVGRTAQKDLPAILRALDGVPVLTVSDDELFVKQGGMMNFVRQNSRIRFDLNLDAVARGQLKISSRLYGLARLIVKDDVIQEGR
ncbi:MAG: hypothetical protein BA870_06345 [Desulfuromonadales bacterium C00003094]|nr:MAG: hypothetical protein BA870_06345 [Desulfuromonadales bacterium C00003094]